LDCVDIVIAVHDAPEAARRCLASVFAAKPQRAFEVVVVDDASGDAELLRHLRELARDERITLVESLERQGFAAAINRGVAVHPKRDVVILHSDAVVANDWLDRLCWHAQREPGVGAVAPFCTRGGVAGYPHLETANPLPDAAGIASLDRAFARANPRQSVAMPFLRGPCLYVRRECLAITGTFDASTLGSDHGTDVDFCLRAASVGFHHFLAGDVYVGHAGEASFGADGQADRDRSDEALSKLYPDYPGAMATLRTRAPGRAFARRVDLLRLAASPVPLVVFVAHGWGGGIRRHMSDLAAFSRGRCEVLQLEPAGTDGVKLYWARPEEEFAAYFSLPKDLAELARLLRELGVARLHYHHVHLLPRSILDLPAAAALAYDCTLHDYYAICPQYHLVGADGRYCGEPDAAGCAACIAGRPHRWNLDIAAWRGTFASFLRGAQRVIAPSEDVARRIRRYVPELAVAVWPHPEFESLPLSRVARVVILGNLSPEKGLRVVASCVEDARDRGLPLTFRVLGSTTEPIPQAPEFPLSIVGQYDDTLLPALLAAEKPDVIFFPAQVPETYSYTLSVALASGVPVVASSLGALPERIGGHARSTAVRWNAPASEWNAALAQAAGIGTGEPRRSGAPAASVVTS
jgi:GT2 family glycosyltransferase/glycosyltransferase involved in cell wall biosynthesis